MRVVEKLDWKGLLNNTQDDQKVCAADDYNTESYK
jgi:hypothetical protein